MKKKMVIGLTTAMFVTSVALAGDADSHQDTSVQAQLEAMRVQLETQQATIEAQHAALRRQDQKIAELSNQADEHWLSGRRAEEVKSLIRDVLQDADTRASLLDNGVNAGYDGGFYISSNDGGFLLKAKGLLQIRHIVNSRENSGSDDLESGFQITRANLFLSGHIADPKLKYLIALAQNRNTGGYVAESARIDYDLTDGLTIKFGRFRGFAFTREERTSYTKQLGVERSYVNEVFTVDYVEGVELWARPSDVVHLRGAIHDGAGSGSAAARDFQNDTTDIALTGRVDIKLAGDWKQAEDFTSWSGEPLAAFFGAAIHREEGETGTNTGANNDFTSWTLDGSIEGNGANLFVAVVGRHSDNETGPSVDQLGLLIQGGIMVIPDKLEPFVQFQYIDFDGFTNTAATTAITGDDTVSIIGFGANYYMAKHNAKLTVDVLVALDPIPMTLSHTGLLMDGTNQENQVVARTQFQLMF